MGAPKHQLIDALRETAARLKEGAPYRWTHQGMCNCGHLAQTVTHKTAAEIHALAVRSQGEWADHAIDYCPDSGYPVDHIIDSLLDIGASLDDIAHLERLTHPEVTRRLKHRGHLDKRDRDDVVAYMEAWADLLATRS